LFLQYGGSFAGFLDTFKDRYEGQGTALQLVQMVVDTFPSFRDEVVYEGRTSKTFSPFSPISLIFATHLRAVHFWKRAQILVAELWAAFYPANPETPHPFLSKGVNDLTMFADYRVPQILHQLSMLTYPPELVEKLTSLTLLPPGSREEVSIRAASILAVEALRDAILAKRKDGTEDGAPEVNSVLLDFYLWDLATALNTGGEVSTELNLAPPLPAHRTRSIWY
jgi:hypothetical protein